MKSIKMNRQVRRNSCFNLLNSVFDQKRYDFERQIDINSTRNYLFSEANHHLKNLVMSTLYTMYASKR